MPNLRSLFLLILLCGTVRIASSQTATGSEKKATPVLHPIRSLVVGAHVGQGASGAAHLARMGFWGGKPPNGGLMHAGLAAVVVHVVGQYLTQPAGERSWKKVDWLKAGLVSAATATAVAVMRQYSSPIPAMIFPFVTAITTDLAIDGVKGAKLSRTVRREAAEESAKSESPDFESLRQR
jgi:hypothetical protein